uniref:Uncharacterized protein n=1 Tax=Arundo donax TaxID=35708 RepID=A0A0A9BV95_ARUDO
MEANKAVADDTVEEAGRDPIRWLRATSSGSAAFQRRWSRPA